MTLVSALIGLFGAFGGLLIWWLRRESRKQKADEIARHNAESTRKAVRDAINTKEKNRAKSSTNTDYDNVISL